MIIMNALDILLLLLLAVIIVLAVRRMHRNRKSGNACGCGCGSPGCTGCAGRGASDAPCSGNLPEK